MNDKQKSNTRVITGEVRLSYPQLFKPRAAKEGQDAKYSVEILIPKTDTKTMAKIRAAQNEAATDEKGVKTLGTSVPTWGAEKFPAKKWLDTVRDGDDEEENDGRPERKGHWFMNVRSDARFKPGVVDKNLDKVIDESEVYGGVFARVSMTAYPFAGEQKGISFGLNNVQVLGKGESFGAARESAEDEFDDGFEIEDGDDDLI